jgi:peptidoglycan DL-endopeptidase CwlO
MAIRGISGTAVAFTLGGIVLLYAGLRGQKLTTTVTNLLGGKVTGTGDSSLAVQPTSSVGSSVPASNITATPGGIGGTPDANKAIGKMYAATYGWYPGAEWDALDKLWTHESNWNNTAMNPSSGAYGIAQALPSSKYPKAAQPPPNGVSYAPDQIAWGLAYIKGRYGDPIGAWNHELANNWY